MELIELSESDRSIYTSFLLKTETASFLQSWEWGEWQKSLGRRVFRFKFVDEHDQVTGVIQLIAMPLPFGRHYLYIPLANFQFSIFNFQLLAQELRKKFSDAVFLRVEPMSGPEISNLKSEIRKSTNIQPAKTLIIDLTKTEEQLLADMHNKTRYNIKVAQKHGVEIKDEFSITNGHGLYFEEALKLISETAQRQGFKTFTPDYYKQMVDFFTLHHRGGLGLHVYKAVYKGTLLATAIMVDFGTVRTFLFGGSSAENKNVMAPYLLHFQAMLDAKNANMTKYDFWGIETSGGQTPGFVRFKLGFAPQIEDEKVQGVKQYAGAYDIPFNSLWYTIYTIVRGVNRFLK